MFEHLCKEKDGPIWRAVWIPEPSVAWATRIVDKMQGVKSFLDSTNPFATLLDPNNKFFQVDEVGMIAVMPLPKWEKLLHVHVTFWDGRLRGREGLCRSLSILVTRMTDKFLFTQIPEDRAALLAFAKRVGYTEQGTVGSNKIMYFTNYTE